MVEIMLPKNSRVKKGKVWPGDKAANGKKPKRTKEFKVYRYNPDEGGNPTVDTYTVDLDSCGPTMLGPFVTDCTPFLVNAPLFLNPNEVTSSFDMFTVTIQTPFGAPFTSYPGVFDVLGSVEGPNGPLSDGSTVLGSADFSVQVVPEPATVGFIGAALVFGLFRVRRLAA